MMLGMSELARAGFKGHDMYAIVGQRLFMLAWNRGESATKLARMMGLSQSPMSKKLRGERRFDLNEILWLADHFGVDVAWLLREPTEDEQLAVDGRPGRKGLDDPKGTECAIRDSNPEPADMSNRLVRVDFANRTTSRTRTPRRPRPNGGQDELFITEPRCISQLGHR